MAEVADAVINEARTWLGTPYHHQASIKGIGCDCLGLIRGIYRVVIGPEPEALPPYTPDWAEASGRETLLEAAYRYLEELPADHATRPGDVLLFRWRPWSPAKHAAIAIGGRRMIHAYDGAGVVEVSLTPSWEKRIARRFAFPEQSGSN